MQYLHKYISVQLYHCVRRIQHVNIVLISQQSVLALGCTGKLSVSVFSLPLSGSFTRLMIYLIRLLFHYKVDIQHDMWAIVLLLFLLLLWNIQIPIHPFTDWSQWLADQSWPTGTNEHLCFAGTEVSQGDNHRRRSKYLVYFILTV